MNIEEFETATDHELRQKAKERFAALEFAGYDDRPAMLLEAKLYLDEIQSRRDVRVARRDLFLELIVILLIGIEIVLGTIGIRESNQQYQILSNLNSSATDTAKSLRSLYEEQQRLVEVQKKKLDSVSSMNSATQNQLLVLRQDQKEKMAELAKKPTLQLSVGGVQL